MVVIASSTKVVVVGHMAVVNIGGGGRVVDAGGGVVVVSRCCCPCCPPPRHPHPPHGAGWWWWGRCHRRAPHLACAPHCRSCPCCRLVVMPVPLLIIPLVIIDVLPWHWPWTSCHHCRHVDAGRVVGLPSIVLSSSSCPLLSSLCHLLLLLSPLPSSSLSHCCPPRLPLVVVVHDR